MPKQMQCTIYKREIIMEKIESGKIVLLRFLFTDGISYKHRCWC